MAQKHTPVSHPGKFPHLAEATGQNAYDRALAQRLLQEQDHRALRAGRPMKKRAFYNEMYQDDGGVRPHYEPYSRWLEGTAVEHLLQKQREADAQRSRQDVAGHWASCPGGKLANIFVTAASVA